VVSETRRAESTTTWRRNARHGTKPINPWSWSIKLGFDQAQLIEGHRRQLVCSGQDAVDADGNLQLVMLEATALD
jgi:hypothetical protein